MRAEIISIGTELLLGSILNTNARFLSQRLAEKAIDVYHQVTVGDNPARLIDCFKTASQRSDIVICSGGLGPTEDDVTVRALAQFLKKPLALHRPTYRYVSKRLHAYRVSMTKLVARQCYIPQGAVVLQNDKGTAPGILCHTRWENKKKWILLLPGPPRELEPLFTQKALPLLLRRVKISAEFFSVRTLRVAGLLEPQVAQKIRGLLKLRPPATLGIYARPGEVELKIMSKAGTRKEADFGIKKIETIIRKRLSPHQIMGADHDTLSSVAGGLLRKNKLTLSIAESCTGGFLSHQITENPGSSDYYSGGIVAYDNAVKISTLGISPFLLKKHGAVSSVVAKKMAEGIQKRFSSDLGIGITGIAGPSGGSHKKPVGLVYIALALGGRTKVIKNNFQGTRSEIKFLAAQSALNLLRLELLKLQKAPNQKIRH